MKRTHILWIVLILAGLGWLLLRSGGPEGAIRARLGELEELLEKEPGEKALASAQRARELTDFLSDDFLVDLGPRGRTISDAAGLARPYVGFRRGYDRITVGLELEEIEVGAGERSAATAVRASFLGTGGGGVGPSRESYHVLIDWVLEDGEWTMSHVQVTERVDAGI